MSNEEQNLKVVQRWAELYTTDAHAMIDECYAKDAAVYVMGVRTLKTPEDVDAKVFREAEDKILRDTPDRRFEVEHTLAKGDTVTVEGVFHSTSKDGTKSENPFCAVLVFRDGKIVVDRTYAAAFNAGQ